MVITHQCTVAAFSLLANAPQARHYSLTSSSLKFNVWESHILTVTPRARQPGKTGFLPLMFSMRAWNMMSHTLGDVSYLIWSECIVQEQGDSTGWFGECTGSTICYRPLCGCHQHAHSPACPVSWKSSLISWAGSRHVLFLALDTCPGKAASLLPSLTQEQTSSPLCINRGQACSPCSFTPSEAHLNVCSSAWRSCGGASMPALAICPSLPHSGVSALFFMHHLRARLFSLLSCIFWGIYVCQHVRLCSRTVHMAGSLCACHCHLSVYLCVHSCLSVCASIVGSLSCADKL